MRCRKTYMVLASGNPTTIDFRGTPFSVPGGKVKVVIEHYSNGGTCYYLYVEDPDTGFDKTPRARSVEGAAEILIDSCIGLVDRLTESLKERTETVKKFMYEGDLPGIETEAVIDAPSDKILFSSFNINEGEAGGSLRKRGVNRVSIMQFSDELYSVTYEELNELGEVKRTHGVKYFRAGHLNKVVKRFARIGKYSEDSSL